MLANGWTPERKARQAEAIRRWKPWEKSTGPRTVDGKAKSSRNAFKNSLLQRARALCREVNAMSRELRLYYPGLSAKKRR